MADVRGRGSADGAEIEICFGNYESRVADATTKGIFISKMDRKKFSSMSSTKTLGWLLGFTYRLTLVPVKHTYVLDPVVGEDATVGRIPVDEGSTRYDGYSGRYPL